jgi:hypothetical protein
LVDIDFSNNIGRNAVMNTIRTCVSYVLFRIFASSAVFGTDGYLRMADASVHLSTDPPRYPNPPYKCLANFWTILWFFTLVVLGLGFTSAFVMLNVVVADLQLRYGEGFISWWTRLSWKWHPSSCACRTAPAF